MAGGQDIIQLPYKITEFNKDMLVALDRNFKEIERMLSILQLYMKQTGKVIDQAVSDNKDTWDRANSINSDGSIPTEKLTSLAVGLQNALQLADEAVTAAKLAVGSITTPKLADNAVTDTKLAAGTITEAKMNWKSHIIY